MNRVSLIGRPTREIELKLMPNTGLAVARFTLAVDNYNSNTKEKGADFIPVVVFGKRAETIAQYVDKGNQVAITGHIHSGSYEDKEGKKHYTMEVIADNVELLYNKKKSDTEDKDIKEVNDGGIPF